VQRAFIQERNNTTNLGVEPIVSYHVCHGNSVLNPRDHATDKATKYYTNKCFYFPQKDEARIKIPRKMKEAGEGFRFCFM